MNGAIRQPRCAACGLLRDEHDDPNEFVADSWSVEQLLLRVRRLEEVVAKLQRSADETFGFPHLDTCKTKYGGAECTCGLL